MKRIAINGFGRIGRAALKVIMDIPDLEVVAVNDLMTIENAAYLLKHDTVYRTYSKNVSYEEGKLKVGDKSILYLSIKDPAQLPWKDNQVDVVIESTGLFTNRSEERR